MKLLSVRVENFRMIKSLELDFSTGQEGSLTMIRAANESGKTTLLVALQWGLYGDEALPGDRSRYRLSPIDATVDHEKSVTSLVEVNFRTPTKVGHCDYRIIRFAKEFVNGNSWQRISAGVSLYQMGASGATKIDKHTSHINAHLPSELREVFFTDGDKALTFIEGDKATQSKRVEDAIRSLLSLEVIENSIKHVQSVRTILNSQIKKAAGNNQVLRELTERLERNESDKLDLVAKIKESREKKIRLRDLAADADGDLMEALKKGDRHELEQKKRSADLRLKSAIEMVDRTTRSNADLFRSKLLAKQLFASELGKAKLLLNDLHKRGKIPNKTIPVLVDRLEHSECICGESLDPEDEDGRRRRDHISSLVEESRQADEIQEVVTELYFGSRDLLASLGERTWETEYTEAFVERQRANRQRQDVGEELASYEAEIRSLPDTDVGALQERRNHYQEQFEKASNSEVRFATRLEKLLSDISDEKQQHVRLLQKSEKGEKISKELLVADDLKSVLENALDTLKTREVQEVGSQMNRIFLDMIGADPEDGSLIQQVSLTDEFRIAIQGKSGATLEAQDLNGASRRALTLSFVLALAKVSEVEAPNLVDTPLGMMSGYVKQKVLERICSLSSQLILFLTHSEIAGCESILDRYVGRSYTLTNPAHYPKILVNQPESLDGGVMVCECDHRDSCMVCERRELSDSVDAPDTII